MGIPISSIARRVNKMIEPWGYELKPVDPLCEGYDQYADLAAKEDMDVNDYLEERLGWAKTLPALEELVLPHLHEDSCVCELGPGTGRQTRYVLPKLRRGALHLVDHSPWMRSWLKKYLSGSRNVVIHGTDGRSIDLPDNSVDLCFYNCHTYYSYETINRLISYAGLELYGKRDMDHCTYIVLRKP